MPRQSPILAGLFVGLLAVTGCESPGPSLHPAGGRVLFSDGRPVTSGMIEFVPVDSGPAARGRIEPDGHFVLQTGDRPGASAGNYRIVVIQMVVAEGAQAHLGARHMSSMVHAKYARTDTSGLSRDIQAGVNNNFAIEVDSAAPKSGW
jgi:hypothetical protein